MGFYSWPCLFFPEDMTVELFIQIVGTYRVVNGCPESGNSGPTGISSFEFLLYIIKVELPLFCCFYQHSGKHNLIKFLLELSQLL